MPSKILDGRLISASIREQLTKEVEGLKEKGIIPGLAVILVGDDPASHTYVKNKEKTCKQLGMYSQVIQYPATLSETDLIEKIKELNEDDEIHGILVQLPLPKHINEKVIIETISPLKDVDGFT